MESEGEIVFPPSLTHTYYEKSVKKSSRKYQQNLGRPLLVFAEIRRFFPLSAVLFPLSCMYTAKDVPSLFQLLRISRPSEKDKPPPTHTPLRRWPVDRSGVQGIPCGIPPPFSFCGGKKTAPAGVCRKQPPRSGGSWPEAKRRRSRQKKKYQLPGSQALRALPPGGMRLATVPGRDRARPLPSYRKSPKNQGPVYRTRPFAHPSRGRNPKGGGPQAPSLWSF